MRAAYWLSFALALTPLMMQIMGTIFIWVTLSRVGRKADATTKRNPRPAWPFFLLALFAFGLTLWQTVYVDDLFAGYSYDYRVEKVDVLGISIPLELGEKVNRFVGSAFGLLLSIGFPIFFIWMLVSARAHEQLNFKTEAGALGWIFGLIVLGSFGLAIWSSWRALPYQLENLQALF